MLGGSEALAAAGFTDLVVQFGRGEREPDFVAASKHGINGSCYRFTDIGTLKKVRGNAGHQWQRCLPRLWDHRAV